jgi:hypothetical protein
MKATRIPRKIKKHIKKKQQQQLMGGGGKKPSTTSSANAVGSGGVSTSTFSGAHT